MIYKGVPKISEGSICLFYWPRAIELTKNATGYSERVITAVIISNTWQKHHRQFFRAATLRDLLALSSDTYIAILIRECKMLGFFEKVPKQKAHNVTLKGNELNKVFNRFLSELMNNEDIYKAGFDPSTHRKRPKGKLYSPYYSERIYKERNKKKAIKGNVKP